MAHNKGSDQVHPAPDSVSPTKEGWEAGSIAPEVRLERLRRMLDITEEDEIDKALISYTNTVALIRCRKPECSDYKVRAEWALAMAMAPEWYGEELTNRLQNSMLVSALLLTVTAAFFVEPPEGLGNKDTGLFRAFVYMTGFCNVLFLLSIVFGIFFIENAMSRAYGKSDRFILMMKFYTYKNLSQQFMAVGSAVFPLTLAFPMWGTFLHLDAHLLLFFTAVYCISIVYVMLRTTLAASAEHSRRIEMWMEFIDGKTSYVKDEYYPESASMTAKDFEKMYANKNKVKSDS